MNVMGVSLVKVTNEVQRWFDALESALSGH